MNQMLSVLYETGRFDVLLDIKDGFVHPMTVYATWKQTKTFPERQAVPIGMMTEWVESAPASVWHRRGLRTAVRKLEPWWDSPVSELPTILRQLRNDLQPRTFNKLRSAVQAFVRDTWGRRTDLWKSVSDVPMLKYTPTPTEPVPLTVLAHLEHPLKGMALSMATTGMLPSEYWGKWEAQPPGVRIYGTKRQGRDRIVPLVVEPVLPSMTMRGFQEAFRGTGFNSRQLRNTAAKLWERASVPKSRIRKYLGHGVRVVTDIYLQEEVLPYLQADAEATRSVILPVIGRLDKAMKVGLSA